MRPRFPTLPARGPTEDELLRAATQALDLQRWTEARERLLRLATMSPATTKYRALLAYARGQEAMAAGDSTRAQEEWRRALTLDPTMADAQRAQAAQRQRSSSWVGKLLGRA